AGFVLAHWIGSRDWRKSVRESAKPLSVFVALAVLVAAVPVAMTAILAARSNRPEIAWGLTVAGSLHPGHLLTFAFPDLFRAMTPSDADYWGPGTSLWQAAFSGRPVTLAKNMGLLYAGALPLVVTVSFGLVRGLAWSRDIRFFSIAAAATLLYALGCHTPAFHAMYDLLPGVMLFRRPADATFVLGALAAIVAGYLVHRWLEGSVPRPTQVQRIAERAIPVALIALALG